MVLAHVKLTPAELPSPSHERFIEEGEVNDLWMPVPKNVGSDAKLSPVMPPATEVVPAQKCQPLFSMNYQPMVHV